MELPSEEEEDEDFNADDMAEMDEDGERKRE